MAAANTGSPLRGSSRRPRNPIVGAIALPCQAGVGVAEPKVATLTPLGMTTASPPRWLVTVRRASSETAMRPSIFSSEGRSSG